MTYMNDRTVVERIMLPMLMYTVVKEGDSHQDHGTAQVLTWLLEASKEPLEGLTLEHRHKLLNRVNRCLLESTTELVKPGQPVAKMGLVTYYLMAELDAVDRLVMIDGSPFRLAMDVILVALKPAADEEDLNKSAQKQARRFLAILQKAGYFQGITI